MKLRRSPIPYVLAIPLALCLLVGAGYGQSQVIVRPVEVGTNPPLQSLVTGWLKLAPMRQVNIEPKELADIESRMPDGHIYRDADLVTWAHETTHGINSRCRVWAGAGMNAFYCLDGNVAVFREPRLTKSAVCRYVPANLRGDVWGLYMVGQQEWDDSPLYILDEWVAYINGAYVAVALDRAGSNTNRSTLHDIAKSVEFAGYASALLVCIDKHDPSYSDRDKLAKFVAFNIERTMWLARQSSVRPQVEAFATAYVSGGFNDCASGNCQSWSWGQGQWRPARPQQPPTSRPQPPVATKPPSTPPPTGAAGCQCKGTHACKCDPKAKACACDPSKIAALEVRICELEALIKSGKLKGEKGDKGDTGQAGPQGKSAAGEKLPIAVRRPDGSVSETTWVRIGKGPDGKYERAIVEMRVADPKKK